MKNITKENKAYKNPKFIIKFLIKIAKTTNVIIHPAFAQVSKQLVKTQLGNYN